MSWSDVGISVLLQAALGAVIGIFLFFVTRSSRMKNASYAGPGEYDVRVEVDGSSFVLTVYAQARGSAADVAKRWVENNFRERLVRDTNAEVIGPHQG